MRVIHLLWACKPTQRVRIIHNGIEEFCGKVSDALKIPSGDHRMTSKITSIEAKVTTIFIYY